MNLNDKNANSIILVWVCVTKRHGLGSDFLPALSLSMGQFRKHRNEDRANAQ